VSRWEAPGNKFAENALHRQIDQKILASEAARAARPPVALVPETWGHLRCPACGSPPVTGYVGTREQVIIESARSGSIVWAVDQTGQVHPFCGEDHFAAYERQVARSLAPIMSRVTVKARELKAPEPTSWGDHARGATRLSTLACARCKSTCGLAQELKDGEWLPTVAELEAKLLKPPFDWRRVGGSLYCSRLCAELSGKVVPMTGRTLAPLGAAQADLAKQRAEIAAAQGNPEQGAGVQTLDDRSYQRARTAARSGADSMLARVGNREIDANGRTVRPKAPKGDA
jgi:hypothetical protein